MFGVSCTRATKEVMAVAELCVVLFEILEKGAKLLREKINLIMVMVLGCQETATYCTPSGFLTASGYAVS